MRIARAVKYRREQRRYDRSAYDLELWLYSRILSNDMLHYGYFEDPDIAPGSISIADMEEAQHRYAEIVTGGLEDLPEGSRVLDAGCGMGGLTGLLLSSGFETEALTPNDHQAEHVGKKYAGTHVHHCKYEALEDEGPFAAVIHAESLQYIDLEKAFQVSGRILEEDGTWIITDYFRLGESGVNRSGHLLTDFRESVGRNGWEVVEERDMTANVLPTLKLVRLYADRFLLPLKHFALEKFRFKKPFLYAMTGELRDGIDIKLEKELAAIDPEAFKEEKAYMYFKLKKKQPL